MSGRVNQDDAPASASTPPASIEAVACPECDLLQHLPELEPGGKARCSRCGNTLATRSAAPLDRPLALTAAAVIVFIVANVAPLMGLSAVGRHASTTIGGGVYEMWQQGETITAMIVGFCAMIAPGAYLLFMLTVLLAARRPPAPPWIGEMLRWAHTMEPWSIGSNVSSGCVRMFPEDVIDLYQRCPIGTRVLVLRTLGAPVIDESADVDSQAPD